MGSRRWVSYLAVNQREWSPTYNRNTFGRPEDSARIKNYQVFVSDDGSHWGTPVTTAVMPSARGVRFVDLNLWRPARFVKLEVDDTWAAANAPRFFHQLQIDEVWLGDGYATPARPGATTVVEAEGGVGTGVARVGAGDGWSGGREGEE